MNRKRKINKLLSISPHAPISPLSHWKTGVAPQLSNPDECREERRGLAKRYLDQSLQRLDIPKYENISNILRHGL